MSLSNIGIFGADKRQVYIAKALIKQGYNVYVYQICESIQNEKCTELHSLSELFNKCNILIGPTPLMKNIVSIASTNDNELIFSNFSNMLKEDHLLIGGMIPHDLTEICSNKKIPYYDLMKNDKIAILNAIATAEGTIMEAIQSSNINLHNSNCLVLGYGRCAKVLAQKLKGMAANVTIAARSDEALAYADTSGLKSVHLSDIKYIMPTYDFIFNTIPALVLDKTCLDRVKQDVVIIDIASSPGGIDYEYAIEKNLNAKLCLGLPGKVSPKSSANILVNEISKLLKGSD